MELTREYLTIDDLKSIRKEIDVVMDQCDMTNLRIDNLRDVVQKLFEMVEQMKEAKEAV